MAKRVRYNSPTLQFVLRISPEAWSDVYLKKSNVFGDGISLLLHPMIPGTFQISHDVFWYNISFSSAFSALLIQTLLMPESVFTDG